MNDSLKASLTLQQSDLNAAVVAQCKQTETKQQKYTGAVEVWRSCDVGSVYCLYLAIKGQELDERDISAWTVLQCSVKDGSSFPHVV